MQDFGTKADNSPPPGGQLSAAEFNNLATEAENAVLHSGQTLSGASATQLAQSLFLHGVKSESFQDSGAANAYVATPISGTNGVLLPPDYANMGGAVISFKAAASNSAASTLNIGQTTGTLLGAKAIRTQADVAIPAGSIVAGQSIQVIYNPAFNAGAGAWELLPWSGSGRLLGAQIFSTPGTFTYTETAGTKKVIVEVQAPGGAGGGAVATGAGQSSLGAPGGAGSYAKSLLTSGFSGASVVVGLGGAGASGAAGNNGGTSSFGAVISCPGGRGGAVTTAGSGAAFEIGTLNSSAPTGGNISSNVGSGSTRIISLTSITIVAGNAGSTIFGPGGQYLSSGSNGTASTSFGAGGGATGNIPSSSALTGGAGAPGVVIIWEYA